MSGSFSELAKAKVNLTLHVIGQRSDGYRLLDSLVVFPELGDLVEVEEASSLSLTLDGPFGQDLGTDADNLVLKAAELIRPQGAGAAIHLTKSLPIASGIGGGSADAAASLRALSRLWDVSLEGVDALSLGADVPVCLDSQTCRMEGIGEVLSKGANLPSFWLVLVNSGAKVSTPSVFKALERKDNAPMSDPPKGMDVSAMCDWLGGNRNDLQAPACLVEPGITGVLAALEDLEGCQLARMSGSGATCFGVFEEQEMALAARGTLAHGHPLWWCVAAPVKG